jgi:hypothetical protein
LLTAREAETVRLLAEGQALSSGPIPESEAQEAALDAVTDAWDATVERICATQARTTAGRHAKAAALLIVQRRFICDHVGDTLDDVAAGDIGQIEDQLALSLARDLVGRTAA